jgi:hypothetical protein
MYFTKGKRFYKYQQKLELTRAYLYTESKFECSPVVWILKRVYCVSWLICKKQGLEQAFILKSKIVQCVDHNALPDERSGRTVFKRKYENDVWNMSASRETVPTVSESCPAKIVV